jgi:hypothetical protein
MERQLKKRDPSAWHGFRKLVKGTSSIGEWAKLERKPS